jgi:hypothetical protein
MNFINRKSVFSISGILFIILFQLLSGCYTQLDTTSLEKSKSRNYPIQSGSIDYKIIGRWQNIIHWIDGPDQVQQIIFDSNGNILFEDYIGRSNQNSISGSFYTKDSILTIVLDYGYGTEKYYYEVLNGTLSLTPVDMNNYFPYKVSGSGSRIWINPNYRKGNL